MRVLLASAKQVSLELGRRLDGHGRAGAKGEPRPGRARPEGDACARRPSRRCSRRSRSWASSRSSVDGKPYRGKVVVSSDGKLVQVIDTVGLEPYLKGVVPAEMPSNWPPEALKAQAVAARSYALANLDEGAWRSTSTATRAARSTAASTPRRRRRAPPSMRRRARSFSTNGKVADTLFFSTSGGRTASALESTGLDVPYLVSVADPYDTLSPVPRLGAGAARRRQGREAAEARGADRRPADDDWHRPAACESVTVVSDDESQVTLTGQPGSRRARAALDVVHAGAAAALPAAEDDDLRRCGLAHRLRSRGRRRCRSKRRRPGSTGRLPAICSSAPTGRSRRS